jgi:hypothetical protein
VIDDGPFNPYLAYLDYLHERLEDRGGVPQLTIEDWLAVYLHGSRPLTEEEKELVRTVRFREGSV